MKHRDITQAALTNYSDSSPWPEHDEWHAVTYRAEKKIIEKWLAKHTKDTSIILNAGSGGTVYNANGQMIHLDIVEKYIQQFNNHIVGSVEHIPLADNYLNGIICVGSVLNYADAQRSIREFSRILQPGGFLILEFERTESAEFLFTAQHGKDVFSKEYYYNAQKHLLWMYSEKYVRQLLRFYGFKICSHRRIHTCSSLVYRFGITEKRAARYAKLDRCMHPISYPLAHNVILLCTKKHIWQRKN